MSYKGYSPKYIHAEEIPKSLIDEVRNSIVLERHHATNIINKI